MSSDATFLSIRELAGQLYDSGVTPDWQMLKIMEEVGEVASAWFGCHGMNKRKGVTHEIGDVLKELADVAITALIAIELLGHASDDILKEKLAGVRENYKDVK